CPDGAARVQVQSTRAYVWSPRADGAVEAGLSRATRRVVDVTQQVSEWRGSGRLPRQQGEQVHRRTGFAEQLALSKMARVPAQEVELAERLDALCDHFHAEAAAQLDDRFHDRRVPGVFAHIAHERLVDLEGADGKLLQGRERGVAGAEVVYRQVQAHRIQLVQQAH